MKALYDNLPEVEIGGRKLVGRVLFGLLLLISALVGATAGLLLVYTTDLPQVDALENYRPSSITELYDDRDRVIGSFALQRRVVALAKIFLPCCATRWSPSKTKISTLTQELISGASSEPRIGTLNPADACRAPPR